MKMQRVVAMLVNVVLLGGALAMAQTQADGTIMTSTGDGTSGFAGDGGLSVGAQPFFAPYGVAVDKDGNFYFADIGHDRVRKIDVNSGFAITTVAGNGTRGYCGDGGPAIEACLDRPTGLAVDNSGNLYIAENFRVRKVSTAGTITTLAGNGSPSSCGDGQLAYLACLHTPRGIAVDSIGNVYIADEPENRVREILASDGTITTVAGTGIAGMEGDNGSAIFAELSLPTGVALDNVGNLYIADSDNQRIRKVGTGGVITTVTLTGTDSTNFCNDKEAATRTCFHAPHSVGIGAVGNVYVTDLASVGVRKVSVVNAMVAPSARPALCTGCPTTKANLASPVNPASVLGIGGFGQGLSTLSLAMMTAQTMQVSQAIYTSVMTNAPPTQTCRWNIPTGTQPIIFQIAQAVTLGTALPIPAGSSQSYTGANCPTASAAVVPAGGGVPTAEEVPAKSAAQMRSSSIDPGTAGVWLYNGTSHGGKVQVSMFTPDGVNYIVAIKTADAKPIGIKNPAAQPSIGESVHHIAGNRR
jgi:sugar lactone lactonase YvrE